MVQQLKSLRGVGHHLPWRLPPSLETLEWNACKSSVSGSDGESRAEKMKTAAEAVCALRRLKRLTVRQCLTQLLPPCFVSQLPSSMQVGKGLAGCVQLMESALSAMVFAPVPAMHVQLY
jgi:hypothetical protein